MEILALPEPASVPQVQHLPWQGRPVRSLHPQRPASVTCTGNTCTSRLTTFRVMGCSQTYCFIHYDGSLMSEEYLYSSIRVEYLKKHFISSNFSKSFVNKSVLEKWSDSDLHLIEFHCNETSTGSLIRNFSIKLRVYL